MSKGPGTIEKRIADLLAATRDRALSIEEITRHAFSLADGETPTRAQRLSATRATHRLLRRVREWDARRKKLRAALGRERADCDDDALYDARLKSDPASVEAERLWKAVHRVSIQLHRVGRASRLAADGTRLLVRDNT